MIEDEYFLADDIGHALRTLGAEIAGPVGDIEDATAMLHGAGVLDGAVLDVNIRTELIYPIARELRARDVPFVFTTGYDRVSIKPEFHDVPLWEKPFDIVAMAQTVAELVGHRGRHDAQPGASPPTSRNGE
ncbi:response regulator [Bradyrhizobium forestalis]|uniref:response regulator n=1 Tax=Bradyrhizobium forestalis TaxID=1419263 RepID=UPI003D3198CF